MNEARQHKDETAKVASMVRENVIAQLANIQPHPSVRFALAEGRVTLHGWIYDIASGLIEAFDGSRGAFVSLADNPEVQAIKYQARRVATMKFLGRKLSHALIQPIHAGADHSSIGNAKPAFTRSITTMVLNPLISWFS